MQGQLLSAEMMRCPPGFRTRKISRRGCVRDTEPLGHANQHDEIKRRIGKWHIVDVGHLRKHARAQAGSACHRLSSVRPFPEGCRWPIP